MEESGGGKTAAPFGGGGGLVGKDVGVSADDGEAAGDKSDV